MVAFQRSLAAAVAAAVVACAMAARLGAADEPTSATLFDDSVVHEIRLSMHSGDWNLLQAHYLENTYYPADLSWNGHVVRNVGIRSRGSGSRDARKPGLRIDFNEFVSGQTFAGLRGLALDNFRQDPAMLKEVLSMQLFARMGIAAPRVVYARVYVNNDYLGLFGVIEEVDRPFLASRFGEDDGYLYEFEWAGEYRFEWLGPDPLRYAEMFDPKTHESQPPARLYGAIVEMIETITRGPRSTWEQTMSRFLDFDHLLTYLAVEMFLSDHDGLAGDWGLNNFYLYRFEDTDRFQVVPWDKDANFREVDRNVYAGLEGHELFTTAFSYRPLKERYDAALRRCAEIVGGADTTGGSPGWLEREIGRQVALIRSAAHEDQAKAYSNERFEEEVAWMLAFARYRSREVLEQVGRGRP